MKKEVIEDIDRICEDSVNHPVVAEESDDDRIASIAAEVIALSGINEKLERQEGELRNEHRRVDRIIAFLIEELGGNKGHFTNLDKRVIDLEGKYPRKKKPYKEYTI